MSKKNKEKKEKREYKVKLSEDVTPLDIADLKEFDRNVINLFKTISKPFNDGAGEKEKVMLNLLKAYNATYEKGVGIVVPAVEKRRVAVISHMDLIPIFNKGFAENVVCELGVLNNRQIVAGALDNTITNALLMVAIRSLRDQNKALDVEFVFTEGEETGFFGMKEYIKKGTDCFFVNLDVTNDNLKYHASIEYDKPSYNVCKQIEAVKTFTKGFTKERVCDDLDVVVRENANGVGYCLPTDKTIHSYKNFTYIENLEPYLKGLIFLLSELKTDSVEPDIIHLDINKALSYNYDEFVEKEAKAKEKEIERRNSFDRFNDFDRRKWNYSGNFFDDYPSHGFDSGTGGVFDLVANFMGAAESDNETLSLFLEDRFLFNTEFNLDELANAIGFDEAVVVIDKWSTEGLIKTIDTGVYVLLSDKKSNVKRAHYDEVITDAIYNHMPDFYLENKENLDKFAAKIKNKSTLSFKEDFFILNGDAILNIMIEEKIIKQVGTDKFVFTNEYESEEVDPFE